MIGLTEPVYGEREQAFVNRVLDSGMLSPGSDEVDAFEDRWAQRLGMAEAVAVSSGTLALAITLSELAKRDGGELVAVPTFTCAPTVAAVWLAGLTPVMVDCDPATFGMDWDLLDRALGDHDVVAAVPVHVYGRCVDMRVFDVCDARGVTVVEDAAEAHGASTPFGQAVGTLGDLACWSFRSDKMITTMGAGGAITGDDSELLGECRRARDLYLHPSPLMRYRRADDVGWGAQMPAANAAFGRAQIDRMNEIVTQRRDVAEKLSAYVQCAQNDLGHVFWRYPVAVSHPEQVVFWSRQKHDVEMLPVFWPLHEQKIGEGSLCYLNGEASRIARSAVCVPCHGQMTDADVEKVHDVVKELG